MIQLLIYLLFFVSGLSALIYELLWLRHLGFIFGNTVQATSTVLTAFMGGLGLGAFWFGRKAPNLKRPILWFGLLEYGIAAYAILIPFLFMLLRLSYKYTHLIAGSSPLLISTIRFILAVLIMLLPTVFMGGTLPLLTQGLISHQKGFARKLSLLYGINTMGAVTGILISGFILIPTIGLNGTNVVAIILNLFVATSVLLIARVIKKSNTQSGKEETIQEENLPTTKDNHKKERLWAVILAPAAAGFLALSLEVAWFRALILIFGSTTYSFSAMLAVFLLGIALGSMVFGWIFDHISERMSLFAAALIGVGGYTVWSMTQFEQQTIYFLQHMLKEGFSWSAMISAKFMITFFFLCFPALIFGLLFPLATRMARAQMTQSSRAVGVIYASNTIGTILGSFLTGFIFLPKFGIINTLTGLAVAALAASVLFGLLSKGRWWVRIPISAVAIISLMLTFINPPSWSQKLLVAGPYFSPRNYIEDNQIILKDKLADQKILVFKEGVMATVAVTLTDDQKMCYVSDGKVEADNSPRSCMLQRMMGHLPMLFHPDPQRVMNIGLGAGMSFGALGCYPVTQLDVVEIEPAAIDIARAWHNYNHNIIEHPDAHVILDDGRNYLLCTTSRYDVITSDPFEPVHAGANHLYTVEHFREAKKKLLPGGIMCQYLPLYELSLEDFRSIMRSFVSVFPDTLFFYTGDDTLLLGFKDGIAYDPTALQSKFSIPAVSNSLAGIGITAPEHILGMFVADMTKDRDAFITSGPLNTDNHPIVEFSAPKSALHFTADINLQVLLDHFNEIPDMLTEDLSEEDKQNVINEHEALRILLESSVARTKGDRKQSLDLLLQAYKLAAHNPIIRSELTTYHTLTGTQLLRMGNATDAAHHFQAAMSYDITDFWSIYNLIFFAMQNGDYEAAQRLIKHGIESYPTSGVFWALQGKFAYTTGHQQQAMNSYAKAVEIDPDNPDLWLDYAQVARQTGNHDTAHRATIRAEELKAKPY